MVRLGRKIKEYIDKHIDIKGYEPSIEDIALILEIPKNKVALALETCNIIKSIDDEMYQDGKITLLDVTPKNEVKKDDMLDLKAAFDNLSEEEKIIIIERYFNDQTQQDVAKMIDENQVYVSRLEKKILKKLKEKMVT